MVYHRLQSERIEGYCDFLLHRNAQGTHDYSERGAGATSPQTRYFRFWWAHKRMLEVFAQARDASIVGLILGSGLDVDAIERRQSCPQVLETAAVLDQKLKELVLIDREALHLTCAQDLRYYGPQALDLRLISDPKIRELLLDCVRRLVDLPETSVLTSNPSRRWHGVRQTDWARISLKTYQGLFQNLDYGCEQVDFILATWSLYYAFEADPLRAFDLFGSLLLALKPGGFFWIDDNSVSSLGGSALVTQLNSDQRVARVLNFVHEFGSTLRTDFYFNPVSPELFEIHRTSK